jgi:hypothetical protein
MQHASSAVNLGFVAGDIIFIFDNAVSNAGIQLATADFVLKTGLAGAEPPVTVSTTKYDLVENVADKKYVLRPTQLMINDMKDGTATTLISGYVPALTQDIGGNAIGIYRSGFVANEHFTG